MASDAMLELILFVREHGWRLESDHEGSMGGHILQPRAELFSYSPFMLRAVWSDDAADVEPPIRLMLDVVRRG